MVQSKSITKESKESQEEEWMNNERKFEHRLEERDIDVLHNQANPNQARKLVSRKRNFLLRNLASQIGTPCQNKSIERIKHVLNQIQITEDSSDESINGNV